MTVTAMPMIRRARGRPPKGGSALLSRINIRVPMPVMVAIEDIRDERKDGVELSQIIRELLVEALENRRRI